MEERQKLMVLCPKCGLVTWTRHYADEVQEVALTRAHFHGITMCDNCGVRIRWSADDVLDREEMKWKK